MKITVTHEFDNPEEAIRALALLAGIAAPAAAPEAKDKPERKPRADKGQSRAPYAPRTTAEAPGGAAALADGAVPAKSAGIGVSGASTPSAPGVSAPNAAPAAPVAQAQEAKRAESTPPAAATTTADDVQNALEKLFNKLDYEGSVAVLQRFGVARGKDLAQAQRAEFVRRAQDICAGKYAATAAWPE